VYLSCHDPSVEVKIVGMAPSPLRGDDPGKADDPPDQRYWLVAGDVPSFVRYQGAMYLHGPVWRIELAQVEWPK
jgi:hypothetical protein